MKGMSGDALNKTSRKQSITCDKAVTSYHDMALGQ